MLIKSACAAAAFLICEAAFSASSPAVTAAIDLNTASDDQKLSYVLGMEMLELRARQGFTLDADMVARAIRDEQEKTRPDFSSKEYMATVLLMRERIAAFDARWKALGEKNLAEGNAFLQRKASEPGIHSTGSGLLYKVIREGTGERPNLQDIARIHYRGTLLNGEEFDSSFKRGKPADFPVGKVKPGLKEVLLLMREGAKWEFYAPPHLAYGAEGAGSIGPQETLTTQVELIEILP